MVKAKRQDKDDDFQPVLNGVTTINTKEPTERIDTLAEKYDIRSNIIKSASDKEHHSHDFGELMIH